MPVTTQRLSPILIAGFVGLLATVSAAQVQKAGPAAREPELVTEIRREGSGDRRTQLNLRELAPFDFKSFEALSEVTGTLPTAESSAGKPIVVLTYSSWTPTSKDAVTRIAAAVAKYSQAGIIVVAAHADKRFEDGVKLIAEQKLDWVIGKDIAGKFRSAMSADSDPDMFIIDKAGQMRFADIEGDSIEKALEVVALETADAAKAKLENLKTVAASAKAEAARTKAVADVYRPGIKVRGTYIPPTASEYEKALWPRKNDKDTVSQQATDVQGKELPKDAQDWATAVEWLSPKPDAADFAGKVVVLEFWATWCGPCKRAKPMLDDLAEKNRDDLMMVAFSGYSDPKVKVQDFLRANKSELVHVYEPPKDDKGDDNTNRVYAHLGINGIPFAVVMSTDGKVRWMGNPNQSTFRKTVEEVIKVDPGVQTRRKADEDALKARGG